MDAERGDLIFHIGGKLSLSGRASYVGGKIAKFEGVDVDKIGYFTIMNLARRSGYEPSRMWFAKPGCNLAKGLTEILTDAQVSEMVSLLLEAKSIDIYIEGDERNESDPDEEEVEGEDESVENFQTEQGQTVEMEVDLEADIESDYLGSDVDIVGGDGVEEQEQVAGCGVKSRMYDPECDHRGLVFEIGLSFDSLEQFKEAVQDYAILNGVNVHWVRGDNKRMEVACIDGCPWRVYAGWLQRERTVVVKACSLEHKCTRSLKNRQASVKWLAREFIKMNRPLDSMKAREVIVDLMDKYALQVKKLQVYRAKWEAQKILNGTVEEHYKKIRAYISYLSKRCPNSTFKLELEFTPSLGLFNTFKWFYVGFNELTKGFRSGCRNVVGFDGTFLKHAGGGILLSAVGRDGNNHMYPIAWAVVERENTQSWLYPTVTARGRGKGRGRGRGRGRPSRKILEGANYSNAEGSWTGPSFQYANEMHLDEGGHSQPQSSYNVSTSGTQESCIVGCTPVSRNMDPAGNSEKC